MTVVEVPGSKSITARALILAAAAEGRSTLVRPLHSDDTEALALGLRDLGYRVEMAEHSWAVDGSPAGPPEDAVTVFCRDGATTARFLPALAACGSGDFSFDSSDQMRRRPMAPLTHALRELGVEISFGQVADHHPLTVHARGINGGEISLDAGTSSQFLSALLLIGPMCRGGLSIKVTDLVSAPYVGITLAMMRSFGVEAALSGDTYHVPAGRYRARNYVIEPDA